MILLTAPETVPLDMNRIVHVLEVKENGRWKDLGGKLCIKPKTWARFSKIPYDIGSRIPAISRMVAAKILEQAAKDLTRNNIKVSVFRLALCYRWGSHSAIGALETSRLRYEPAYYSYAEECTNLYYDSEFQ